MFKGLVIVLIALAGAEAFSTPAVSSSFTAPSMRLRSPAACSRGSALAAGLRMQTKDSGDEDSNKVDSDLSTLNARIQQLKERESNPILNAQDKMKDALEPVQFEAAKMKNKMPDPRAAIPVTGLPKWVLPISAILGLSILSAVLSSTAQQTSNLGPGLASGSL